VVPVKDLATAKQRLAPVLEQAERTALYRAMLLDVLDALAGAEALAGILVVTRDPDARREAQRRGAQVLEEPSNRGHTQAAVLGVRHLAARGVTGMLQVPGDLPLLSSSDVDALAALHGDAPAVTIAPSRDRRGSNAVACSPADLLTLRFGDDSFHPHLERARALGLEPRVVEREGIALDVDTPEDLSALLACDARVRALEYLRESGIAARLKALAPDPHRHRTDSRTEPEEPA
jgi:2-phospho-L-lactate guanylyltransferase